VVLESELQEVFERPAVREVACEVRFTPRLRVNPEIWRVQDRLADEYPQVGEEETPQAEGRFLHTYVFSNPSTQRLIKVSQDSLVVVFNRYTTFEDFKAEAVAQVTKFSQEFDIRTYHRAGLRYVNHIELPPGAGMQQLRKYVNAPADLTRFDPESIEQFMTEFRVRAGPHKLTLRSALIQVPTKADTLLYILDLDCYTFGVSDRSLLAELLDQFHERVQIRFLEHVTEEYKQVMRGA
jgi:uncharacterized protein (TIGR04255 family)